MSFRCVPMVGGDARHLHCSAADAPAHVDGASHVLDIQRKRALPLVARTRARQEFAAVWYGFVSALPEHEMHHG